MFDGISCSKIGLSQSARYMATEKMYSTIQLPPMSIHRVTVTWFLHTVSASCFSSMMWGTFWESLLS